MIAHLESGLAPTGVSDINHLNLERSFGNGPAALGYSIASGVTANVVSAVLYGPVLCAMLAFLLGIVIASEHGRKAVSEAFRWVSDRLKQEEDR